MSDEYLIFLVQESKCLWDQNDPNYFSRSSQRAAWKEISSEMAIPMDEVRRKWREMKDIFRRELRKTTKMRSENAFYKSKWRYFKRLLFLRDTFNMVNPNIYEVRYVEPDSIACETSDPLCAAEVSTTSAVSPYPDSGFKSPTRKKLRSNHIFDEGLLHLKEHKRKYYHGNSEVQFLISLLPFLKDIPKSRQLIVRGKLMKVFSDEQEIETLSGVSSNFIQHAEHFNEENTEQQRSAQNGNVHQLEMDSISRGVSNIIQYERLNEENEVVESRQFQVKYE